MPAFDAIFGVDRARGPAASESSKGKHPKALVTPLLANPCGAYTMALQGERSVQIQLSVKLPAWMPPCPLRCNDGLPMRKKPHSNPGLGSYLFDWDWLNVLSDS